MLYPARLEQSQFWRVGHFKVFISHISKHKKAATKLQTSLLPHHIHAFVAHSDIQPTREWENEILQTIRTGDAMVTLLHKGFHKSDWTDQEIGIAMGHGLLTVSISFGETPYGFIGRYQALQGRGKSYDQLSAELYKIFLTHPQTRRAIAESLVDKFANSYNFENAKRNMTLLESVEYWDTSLAKKARQAIKENDQLSESWGVPRRLDAHIRKWTPENEDIPF